MLKIFGILRLFDFRPLRFLELRAFGHFGVGIVRLPVLGLKDFVLFRV